MLLLLLPPPPPTLAPTLRPAPGLPEPGFSSPVHPPLLLIPSCELLRRGPAAASCSCQRNAHCLPASFLPLPTNLFTQLLGRGPAAASRSCQQNVNHLLASSLNSLCLQLLGRGPAAAAAGREREEAGRVPAQGSGGAGEGDSLLLDSAQSLAGWRGADTNGLQPKMVVELTKG